MIDQNYDKWKDESLNVLIGLLDFDSDRATTHASFVVASIFGIYSVLFAFEDYFNSYNGRIIFILTYIFLSILGLYSFLNFSKYASRASAAKFALEKYYFNCEEIKTWYETVRDRESKSLFLRKLQKILKSNFWKKRKIGIFIILWGIAVGLPFLWIILN